MRKQQTALKKRITFEEWKARKDTESKKAKEIINEQKNGITNNLQTRDRGANPANCINIALKQIGKFRTGNEAKSQRKADNIGPVESETLTEDRLIVKDSGSLTFREWLHNKNTASFNSRTLTMPILEVLKGVLAHLESDLKQQTTEAVNLPLKMGRDAPQNFQKFLDHQLFTLLGEMRRKLLEEEEKERKKRERDENGKKAYNTWLIQNKHRTLEKYYPQLGEEKIKAILLQDISKLGLTLSKDVGVGELSAGHPLSDGTNSPLTQRKERN